ncbi:ABC transporter ATP-binding protein [Oryzifoliimicrobium ureilyticus]|uniref:ABC transporter ATP-binding protein n=1 Tax=Oryzifoliimicrobium ureilyticus TaxID=3113724 RepID=UPI00307674F9
MTTDAVKAVSLKKVAISFGIGQRDQYDAVSDIDLDIGEQEFVAIVGPTGCGKSTLLNVAAGLLRPYAGSVEVFGTELTGINRRAGYLFQQDALMPWKTAIENVALGLEVAGMGKRDAADAARQALARVGLAAFADRYPLKLSGGQRKRVGLAQVLIRNPQLLLMDEPFGPLDAQTRLLMGDLLLTLWSQNKKAVMFVTHDLDEAIALADRIILMSAGPRSKIIGEFNVPLTRPRDIGEIRHNPDFIALHRQIWHALKGEVMKAYDDMPKVTP